MLPDMFRQLVKDSNELAGQKDEAIKARDFALQSDKLLRRQVKNLSEELETHLLLLFHFLQLV